MQHVRPQVDARAMQIDAGRQTCAEDESWLKKLGPGIVTGAADDDPSGIAGRLRSASWGSRRRSCCPTPALGGSRLRGRVCVRLAAGPRPERCVHPHEPRIVFEGPAIGGCFSLAHSVNRTLRWCGIDSLLGLSSNLVGAGS